MEWGELPSVVLLEIYDYLNAKDRLTASSVCKNWRAPVFQVPLSNDELILKLCSEADIPKVKFLSRNSVIKVQAVSLIFDASSPNCLDLVEEILGLLEDNTQLKSLRIRFSEESVGKGIFGEQANTNALILRNYFTKKVLEPLNDVLLARNCLETFSFPFIQELALKGSVILNSLSGTAKLYSIRKLFLATIQNDVHEYAGTSLLSTWDVNAFVNLQMLSLDHDMLSDDVLSTLGKDSRTGGLIRLNLTAVQDNPNVSNIGWTKFVAINPTCGVRLTITGRHVVVNHASNLLFPSTPITHFRTMYCKGIRMSCMNSLIRWNEKRLEHLELIDENYDWMEYIRQAEDLEGEQYLDPFIYAAWRCPNLRTIKIGFVYCGHNLVGIARLKGSNLSCLEIPKSQVLYHNITQLSQEISKALGRKWRPTDESTKKLICTNSKIPRNILQTMNALYEDEI